MKSLKKIGTVLALFAIAGFAFLMNGCAELGQAGGALAGGFIRGAASALTAEYSYDECGNVVVTQAPAFVESADDGFVVEDDGGDFVVVNIWTDGGWHHRRIGRAEFNHYHQRFANARGQHHLAGPRQHYNGQRGTPTGQLRRATPGSVQGGPKIQSGGNQKYSGSGKKDKKGY